jgi:murein DD-endopeptidase MepM/ murein hydrolase activator NlpD
MVGLRLPFPMREQEVLFVGHHRADVPSAARAGSGTPATPGRRAADVPVDSPSSTTSLRVEDIQAEALRQAERAAYVGRRRAAVPASPEIHAYEAEREAELVSDDHVATVLSSLEPVDHSTSFDHEDTAKIVIDRSAPVQVVTTYVNAEPAPAGKRRASRHTGTRGPLFKALPSAPVLVGIAALAISIGGAVTLNDQDPASAGSANGLVHASALSGSGGTGKVGDRSDVVSRDGVDRAQADAAGTDQLPAAVAGMAEQRAGALGNLAERAEKHAQYLALDLWQYPLSPVILTARFGQYGLWSSYHTGLDFNGNTGDEIHAIANGVVTFASYDGSYGNKTVVTLDDGTELWYCHQTSQFVGVGDTITRGEVIGTVGATGHVTGSHLHVEVRPGGGDPVDPYPAMQQHGLFLGDEAMPG